MSAWLIRRSLSKASSLLDPERLKVLVERHLLHTGSARAKALLDDWANELKNFRKVMPRDYQRALKALEDEREQAAMEAAE